MTRHEYERPLTLPDNASAKEHLDAHVVRIVETRCCHVKTIGHTFERPALRACVPPEVTQAFKHGVDPSLSSKHHIDSVRGNELEMNYLLFRRKQCKKGCQKSDAIAAFATKPLHITIGITKPDSVCSRQHLPLPNIFHSCVSGMALSSPNPV